jgi:hypothetical protein
MKAIFILIIVISSGFSCSTGKNISARTKMKQGMEGYVKEISGNQMPSPDVRPAQPRGIATAVYIYELTNISQTVRNGSAGFYQTISTKLIRTIQSDSSGHFVAEVPPGSYSIFTRVRGLFYANNFDGQNNIMPVLVEKNKLTRVNFLVSADAVF